MNKEPIDQAFILCAGMGSRMRPYTDDRPKPMVELGGQPLLAHTIRQLKKAGVKKIGVNTHYKADVIRNWLTENEPDVFISHEETLLDTGGGLKKALPHFENKPFFSINGDAFWVDDPKMKSLNTLRNHWEGGKMDILLLLQDIHTMPENQAVGDYDMDDEGHAVRAPDKNGQYMFTSIRIHHPRIFDRAPDGAFNYRDLMDHAQAQKRLIALQNPGQWYHISTPQDLHGVEKTVFASQREDA